jgi:outer membrane protein OmpA-like peptidoglycan-associated protein
MAQTPSLTFLCLIGLSLILPPVLSAQSQFDNVEVRKLGEHINADGDNRIDAISPDGSMMFVSRTRARQKTSDVYYATRQQNGWSALQLLRGEINDSTNNFIGGITADGQTIAVARAGEIAFSRKVAGVWQSPIDAVIDSFYTDADILNFALSPDGKTLVMALERDDSFGETDLYQSYLQADGSWSTPMNLGAHVNTKGMESGPTFSSDGSTVYYSSDGHKGLGQFDLYSTARIDAEKWSAATHLGNKINSKSNEQFFIVAPDQRHAYFTSDRSDRKYDEIYEVQLTPSDSGIRLMGKIVDAGTGKGIRGRFEFDLLPSNIHVSVDSSSASGEYALHLPYLAKYQMRITADGYFPVTEIIGFDRYEERRLIERDITMKPIKAGAPIELRGVEFESGSAELTAASRPALMQIKKVLEEHPEFYAVKLEGYTDNVGEWEDNLKLSQARADRVREWLIEAGIPADRLSAVGHGEAMPVRTNDTAAGRQANRRVEILFMDPVISDPRH